MGYSFMTSWWVPPYILCYIKLSMNIRTFVNRPFHNRDHYDSRGRHQSYRKPERQLPYDRPGISERSKSRDGDEKSRRRFVVLN